MSGARGLLGGWEVGGLVGVAAPLTLRGVRAAERAAAEAMGEKLTALSIRGELGRQVLCEEVLAWCPTEVCAAECSSDDTSQFAELSCSSTKTWHIVPRARENCKSFPCATTNSQSHSPEKHTRIATRAMILAVGSPNQCVGWPASFALFLSRRSRCLAFKSANAPRSLTALGSACLLSSSSFTVTASSGPRGAGMSAEAAAATCSDCCPYTWQQCPGNASSSAQTSSDKLSASEPSIPLSLPKGRSTEQEEPLPLRLTGKLPLRQKALSAARS